MTRREGRDEVDCGWSSQPPLTGNPYGYDDHSHLTTAPARPGEHRFTPSGTADRAAHETYIDGLRAAMERPHITNPELLGLMDDVYRPDAQVGSGSTAAADNLVMSIPALAGDITFLRDRWGESPPPTVLMSAIGKGYVREVEILGESSKQSFFRKIEKALSEGDAFIKDAVATGLLEAVASESERRGLNRADVIDSLAGPAVLAYLAAWDEFTGA